MSKTKRQKEARLKPSTLPQLKELLIDPEHGVWVERKSPQKWHVRFAQSPDEKRKWRPTMGRPNPPPWARKPLVAVVVRYPKHGYDMAAEKEFQATMGGTYTWHDALDPAIEEARRWLIMQEAVKRLRGDW